MPGAQGVKRLSYIGDGPRDRAMVPPLVESVIGAHEMAGFTAWREIKLNHGYEKKLLYALRRAEVMGMDGVVATVDRDRDPQPRRPALVDGREGSSVPAVVGEAVPHGEAWLIDDLEALREVLSLSPEAKAPPGRNPKAELDALIDAAGRAHERLDVLGDLARAVRIARCRGATRSGLAAFLDDVRCQFV